jgi:hypothetical protein
MAVELFVIAPPSQASKSMGQAKPSKAKQSHVSIQFQFQSRLSTTEFQLVLTLLFFPSKAYPESDYKLNIILDPIKDNGRGFVMYPDVQVKENSKLWIG